MLPVLGAAGFRFRGMEWISSHLLPSSIQAANSRVPHSSRGPGLNQGAPRLALGRDLDHSSIADHRRIALPTPTLQKRNLERP